VANASFGLRQLGTTPNARFEIGSNGLTTLAITDNSGKVHAIALTAKAANDLAAGMQSAIADWTKQRLVEVGEAARG
jgi:hypothetical protein